MSDTLAPKDWPVGGTVIDADDGDVLGVILRIEEGVIFGTDSALCTLEEARGEGEYGPDAGCRLATFSDLNRKRSGLFITPSGTVLDGDKVSCCPFPKDYPLDRAVYEQSVGQRGETEYERQYSEDVRNGLFDDTPELPAHRNCDDGRDALKGETCQCRTFDCIHCLALYEEAEAWDLHTDPKTGWLIVHRPVGDVDLRAREDAAAESRRLGWWERMGRIAR